MEAIAKKAFVKNWLTLEMWPLLKVFTLLMAGLISMPQVLESTEHEGRAQSGDSRQDTAQTSVDFPKEIASYIGPEACEPCHQDKYEGFVQTAHYSTSRLPAAHSIAGSFAPEDATMWTRNPNLWFEMSARDDGFYQTVNIWDENQLHEHSERIDIVTGSGKIGQTYLYWKGKHLYELPISYWAASDKWINSPGYLDGQAVFNRPVGPRCLECHATYFEAESYGMEPELGRDIGDNCIDCHMPGRQDATTPVQGSSGIDLPMMPEHLIGIYPDATQLFMTQRAAARQ